MEQTAHMRTGHYWLARTVETEPGSGTCLQRITDRRASIESESKTFTTTFNKGDYAISIEWSAPLPALARPQSLTPPALLFLPACRWDRVAEDAEGLSFQKLVPEDDEAEMPSILNSTELRAVEGQRIDLTKTDGPALSLHRQERVEPVFIPPPPPERRSGRVAALDEARGGPRETPGAPQQRVDLEAGGSERVAPPVQGTPDRELSPAGERTVFFIQYIRVP